MSASIPACKLGTRRPYRLSPREVEISKRLSLAAAMQKASGKAMSEVKPAPLVETQPSTTAFGVMLRRQGKKVVNGHFDPAVSRLLRQLALDQNITVQALLGEALNDLFVKYRRTPNS